MPTLHVLKVFVGEDTGGGPVGGNPLGVFLDGGDIPEEERQPVARELGFPETVFVEDRPSGALSIFTPTTELPFAGHPLVGTAWLLAREGNEVSALRPPAGEVPVRGAYGMTYITGRPEWAPPFEHVEYGSPGEVDSLEGPPPGLDQAGAWSWEDEAEGLVRVRVFVPELGISEDEATGAYAVRLCARLGREISIRQGVGSRIQARPLSDGSVEIGGRVRAVEERDFEVSSR
jgi:predicted PhzF superfamily epimerase YddE/YHI9